MSFQQHCRRVRDPSLSLGKRLMALKNCISNYCRLIHQPYGLTLKRFEQAFALEKASQVSSEALEMALAALEFERRAYLARLEQFSRKRIRQKLLGGRRTPSKAELAAVRQPDFFVVGPSPPPGLARHQFLKFMYDVVGVPPSDSSKVASQSRPRFLRWRDQ